MLPRPQIMYARSSNPNLCQEKYLVSPGQLIQCLAINHLSYIVNFMLSMCKKWEYLTSLYVYVRCTLFLQFIDFILFRLCFISSCFKKVTIFALSLNNNLVVSSQGPYTKDVTSILRFLTVTPLSPPPCHPSIY